MEGGGGATNRGPSNAQSEQELLFFPSRSLTDKDSRVFNNRMRSGSVDRPMFYTYNKFLSFLWSLI